MKTKLDDSRPIYIQIKEFIEDSIINETIKIGERVPSTNELAKFYNINPATARQGMNELVMDNILRKQRGVGMFVTEDAKEILIGNRKKQFYENYIVPLQDEANKLEITKDQLIEMLEKEGNMDEN
ncbi:GntR family transcriptional regulator [Pseudogracilibacillus auburnensis]|uniref:GntR family transcriptional regulator n=1 Tax=Pseudogracilibacillus auburnensis TaxID=1494959 RepID=A0A2V3W9B7_9BACI|nr:GntR family transcriptional regulator [Pseudogracilibacillus auburnensis]MBO1001481.1 GntR family transcriptional regulator [Pseudogracilibacillus auburnensis]PXW89601.1 GntR family transcriptional regulator [Pseudogracilibacillus auburnensis]